MKRGISPDPAVIDLTGDSSPERKKPRPAPSRPEPVPGPSRPAGDRQQDRRVSGGSKGKHRNRERGFATTPNLNNHHQQRYQQNYQQHGNRNNLHQHHDSRDDLFGELPGFASVSHPSRQFRQRLNPNPDDFYAVAEALSQNLPNPAHDGKWKKLTSSIITEYNRHQQSLDTMRQKILLWKEMYRVIQQEFECGLFIFGSTFNGFGREDSDLDMCIFPQGPQLDDKHYLQVIKRLLLKDCRHFIKGNIEFVPAKVPILKFQDKKGNLEVDLSVNNETSIRNTHLLYYYSKCDSRLRPLVMAVKLWAKKLGINEARNQTLSSYTLSLMIIHYLQVDTKPQVLPCLHDAYPNIFHQFSNIFCLDYLDNPGFVSENVQPVGELLTGFFRYYSNPASFRPSKDVASIRRGRVLSQWECEGYARQNKLAPGQWSAMLLVEEPFDRTNAARAVCSAPKWDYVMEVFKETNAFLKKTNKKTVTLEDLLGIDLPPPFWANNK